LGGSAGVVVALDRVSMPTLDDAPVGEAEAEVQPHARALVDPRGLRHRRRRPRADRDDAAADADRAR
jgi:hypothetical protein